MRSLLPIRVLLPLAVFSALAEAQVRQVCLDDQAGLNAPAKGSFYQEFQALVGPRGVGLEDSECGPDAIHLALFAKAEGREADVLGAARQEQTRIAPRLEIYLDRVVAMMPESRCWNVVGRALARVAAHEVAHFIDQNPGHSQTGLLQPRFSGAQLASDDSYPFRWIPAER